MKTDKIDNDCYLEEGYMTDDQVKEMLGEQEYNRLIKISFG